MPLASSTTRCFHVVLANADLERKIDLMKRPKTFVEIAENIGNYRWPKKGDRLLRASDDWDRGVEFSANPVSRHAHIWSGYMRAGAALIEECDQDSVDRHFLIYPILFNYRHGLELAMKWIIDHYGIYAGVRLTQDARDHDLWGLWRLSKQVIIEVGSEGEDDDALRVVEQIVKDFHDLDKSALAFRYSMTKKGATIKLPDISIDLENVGDVMVAVDNFFTGVDGQLDANSSAMDW